MFDFFFDLITSVLAWFYSVWPSYGMAIVFLTLVAMLVSTPLTMKGTRSMLQMQLLGPELKKIQNQHRGDRQAMNEASMAFYKEHGMNPLGGCLPMLAQAPIFLVIYQVVRGLTRRSTEIGTQLGFTSFRYSDTQLGRGPSYAQTPIAQGDLNFDPDFLTADTDLYASLSGKTEMVSWGVDLSRSASNAMSDGVVTALPYLLMMVLVLVTGLFQHHQIQRRQTSSVINPTQQTIMKFIPYFLPVISYGIPAAVVVYFIISSLYRIAQQAYITKSLYSHEHSPGAQLARQRKESADGGSDAKSPGAKQSSRSVTPSKGAPTPKRKAQAPSRANRPGGSARTPARRPPTARGRSGKAPARTRKPTGRTTASGTKPKHSVPNRSKNKKKRR